MFNDATTNAFDAEILRREKYRVLVDHASKDLSFCPTLIQGRDVDRRGEGDITTLPFDDSCIALRQLASEIGSNEERTWSSLPVLGWKIEGEVPTSAHEGTMLCRVRVERGLNDSIYYTLIVRSHSSQDRPLRPRLQCCPARDAFVSPHDRLFELRCSDPDGSRFLDSSYPRSHSVPRQAAKPDARAERAVSAYFKPHSGA